MINMAKYTHKIAESSAFFQGHIGQYFSQDKYVFEITTNYDDRNVTSNFNNAKYTPIFLRTINQLINLRKNEGYSTAPISSNDLIIKGILLVNNEEDEGISGLFKLSPDSALCKKDNCNQYFELRKGRQCGHSDNDPWEQMTFLAYCDECGLHYPIQAMSNINNKCSKCLQPGSLRKLRWKQPDNIISYSVECIHCHHTERLFFYKCDHIDRNNNNQVLSTKPSKGFIGVPSRSSTIIHPYVISIPDIPQEYEIDNTGKRKRSSLFFSDAFHELFQDQEESLLYYSEFHEAIKNDISFWELKRIEDTIEELSLDIININKWSSKDIQRLIRSIIKTVGSKLSEGIDSIKLKEIYGVNNISNAFNQVKEIGFDENDLQGLFLLTSVTSTEKGTLIPQKRYCPDIPKEDFNKLLSEYGLKQIIHIANLNMIQAIIGTITGSTRREPLLFDPIMTGDRNNKKPTVFFRDFLTEGIVFQLDYNRLLTWLEKNKNNINPAVNILPFEGEAENHFRKIISNNEQCRLAILTLLHTYCHMLIQQSTIDTGLEYQSLAERIYPKTASFFLYSTNSLNIGGLEFTYNYHLEDWFSRMHEIATDCPQDPACMLDEGGSCYACSYVPEFVCERFNQDLDRSTLVGGPRFKYGFLTKMGNNYEDK